MRNKTGFHLGIFGASILLLAASSAVQATTWTLSNASSRLNFVSIKAGNIAEAHTFDDIEGYIDASGDVELSINLDSVNTAIDIRNERMREELFDTSSHPLANVRTRIDAAELGELASGQSMRASVDSMLSLIGIDSQVSAELNVTKVNNTTLIISTSKPIFLDASKLGLGAGVEKLRELAGLPAISLAVPVDFNLVFTAQ